LSDIDADHGEEPQKKQLKISSSTWQESGDGFDSDIRALSFSLL